MIIEIILDTTLLYLTPKAQATNTKVNRDGNIKFKSVCTEKENN